MNVKREFIRKKADPRIRRLGRVIRIIILGMSLVVLYDSFRHELPFYYILFLLLGVLIGRIYKFTHRVQFKKESLEVSLSTNRWSIVILLVVLTFRFLVGKKLLEWSNIIWAGDALYLLFIGLYMSKWKVIIRQIDEIYYNMIPEQNE